MFNDSPPVTEIRNIIKAYTSSNSKKPLPSIKGNKVERKRNILHSKLASIKDSNGLSEEIERELKRISITVLDNFRNAQLPNVRESWQFST